MIEKFRIDDVYFVSAAVTMASCAEKLKRIGDSAQLFFWSGEVPQEVLVQHFWPFLVKEFDKLNKYRDYRADIVYNKHCTGINVQLITREQAMKVQEETEQRKGL